MANRISRPCFHPYDDPRKGLREGWNGMAQIMDDVTSLKIDSNTGKESQTSFLIIEKRFITNKYK